MVKKRKPHLSSDKLAYLCTSFTEDMSPVLNRLRYPFFHLLIARLIQNWCEKHGEDTNSCIEEIKGFVAMHSASTQPNTDTSEKPKATLSLLMK